MSTKEVGFGRQSLEKSGAGVRDGGDGVEMGWGGMGWGAGDLT